LTTRRSRPERTISAPRRRGFLRGGVDAIPSDPNAISPATREEMTTVVLASVLLAFIALIVSFTHGYVLLYGDAVAHLGIARRIVDSRNPGLVQLGGVWLPLPHLLMLPFIWKMEWWQSGLAGTWPSLACYLLGVAGFYRLCRRMLVPRWALVATAFYGLNPNLLYLATTAMTEPLFLALLVWLALLTMECVEAIGKGEEKRVRRRMIALGLLIFAAVFTRYDGWIVGAAVWCVIAWQLASARQIRRAAMPFAIFTVLAISGPLLWFWFNQHFFHDWLDFMRGPYSAPAIEKRTSPPGSRHYRGWHNPAWALLFYTRTAQIVAAAWETGFAVMAASVAGLWVVMRKRIECASLLLWVPLPFYVYSVAYGSVPIFIPQLWPHSYYNARYGMEMLPALALFDCFACAAIEAALKQRAPRPAHAFFTLVTALVLLNPVAMIYGTDALQKIASLIERRPSQLLARYSQPLVLKEALVNASTRVPFERNLALVLNEMPPGSPILMQQSDHIGALEDAGIPLKQTINETDYDSWSVALADPSGHALFIVALEGDTVARAVAEHPQELEEVDILCSTGQPCAHIYRSLSYGAKNVGRGVGDAGGAHGGSPAK